MESAMKVFLALTIAQLFLIAAGYPQIGCYYGGIKNDRQEIVHPEDIDPSICSQLLFMASSVDNVTGEAVLESLLPWQKSGNEDIIPRLVKLKAVNPDLKLFLIVSHRAIQMLEENRFGGNVIGDAVTWLNETGFDGLEFPLYLESSSREWLADLICDMKSEFDKYGYMVSALVIGRNYIEPTPWRDGTFDKLARCSNQISLIMDHSVHRRTYRSMPFSIIKSSVERMIDRGIPANMMKFTIASFGVYVILQDPNDTELGAMYSGPGLDYKEHSGRSTIRYKELLRVLNNSSYEWTVRRDNETKEAYAFSSTGLWTSYEDPSSVSFKARYALEKGLLGIDITFLDLDDDEGIEGEGRFPLTRAAYNTFRGGNKTSDAKS